MPQTKRRPGTVHVGFRCRQDEFRRIADAAQADQRSVSSWIRKTLKEATLKQTE
jgi:hypothetical protein